MTVLMPITAAPDTWAAADWPLGSHWDGVSTVTFAVYAPAASRVVLELFAQDLGLAHLAAFDLVKAADGIWRAAITNLGPGAHYGFRAWGPNWPADDAWQRGNSSAGFVCDGDADGHRFNPNKLLFDPYGREVSHNLADPRIGDAGQDGGIFATGGVELRGRPRREYDTATWAPKSIVIADQSSTGTKPKHAPQDAIIYEAHVRGLTAHPSASSLPDLLKTVEGMPEICAVPAELRGTYAGAAYLVPYLKNCGITTVEFLPVHETTTLLGSPDTNYWGYMTNSFFAPNRAYAHDQSPGGPTREFKQMVHAFHAAGIGVYLDVVYNHSGEGGHWAGDFDTCAFTSLGGFACGDYYQLTQDGRLVDGATGTSNQLNFSRAAPRQLVCDSLTYWADDMGVDGFRFDLAPVLGREPDAQPRDDWGDQRRFHQDSPLLTSIRNLAAARDIEIIAEAWDLWGYEVGNFPEGWAEWNGRFRDSLRGFAKGDGNLGDFMNVLNGDFDHFFDQGGPQRSINFLTAHDGFTMADLVSYNAKQNGHPPPFGPSDGGNDANLSWDSGGDQALRRQRLRNFMALLMLSRGVPMIVAGDEYGRTQNGNNNPWNIDSIGIWQNWAQVASDRPLQLPLDPEAAADPDANHHYHDNLGRGPVAGVNPVFGFARAMMNLRREHGALRQRSYGDETLGDDDVTYLFTRPDGSEPVCPQGRAVRLQIDAPATLGGPLLVCINMDAVPVDHVIDPGGVAWLRIADTQGAFEADGNVWSLGEAASLRGSYTVQPWSVVVFAALAAG